jgi:hypothetical protein
MGRIFYEPKQAFPKCVTFFYISQAVMGLCPISEFNSGNRWLWMFLTHLHSHIVHFPPSNESIPLLQMSQFPSQTDGNSLSSCVSVLFGQLANKTYSAAIKSCEKAGCSAAGGILMKPGF